MAFVIYSFGNIEFWDEVLGAVKNVIGSGDFAVVAAVAISIGIVWKALKEGKEPGGLAWYFVTLAILSGLIKGSVDVVVRDEILNRDISVRNVPIIVALPSWLMTNLERALANLFDTAFSLPDGVKYLDFGYNIGSPTFKDSFAFGTLNAYYDRTWTNFMKDCVIPSISQGRIDANRLINSSNIEEELNNVNPAYTTEYCSLSGSCSNMYCDQAWNRIKADTRVLLNTAQRKYAGKVLTEKDIYNAYTLTKFIDNFGNISDYFLNYSVGLADYVKQTLLIHQFYKGLKNSAGYYGTTDDLIARYMAESSKVRINELLLALGNLAGAYIPFIKKILLILFVGTTPILFVLLYIDYLRSKVLFSYFTVLISLTLWEPLFAILNLIIGIAQQNNYGVCSVGTDPLSIIYFSCLTNKATTMTAIAGAVAWAVPTLALGLASGSAHGIVTAVSSITGRISGQVSGSVATTEGSAQTGQNYAKMEEARRLGYNPALIEKMPTIIYTQKTATELLARDVKPNMFYEKSLLENSKILGETEAYGSGGAGAERAFTVGKTEAQRTIGYTAALNQIASVFGMSVEQLVKQRDMAKGIDLTVTSPEQAQKLAEIFSEQTGIRISAEDFMGAKLHISLTPDGKAAYISAQKGGELIAQFKTVTGVENIKHVGKGYIDAKLSEDLLAADIVKGTVSASVWDAYKQTEQSAGETATFQYFRGYADAFTKRLGLRLTKQDTEQFLSRLGVKGDKIVRIGSEGQIITSDGKSLDLPHFLAQYYWQRGDLDSFISALHKLYEENSKHFEKNLFDRHVDNVVEFGKENWNELAGLLVGGILLKAGWSKVKDLLGRINVKPTDDIQKLYERAKSGDLKAIEEWARRVDPQILERFEKNPSEVVKAFREAGINPQRALASLMSEVTLFPEIRGEHLKEIRALRDTLRKELFTQEEQKQLGELYRKFRSGDLKAGEQYIKMWEEKLSSLPEEKIGELLLKTADKVNLAETERTASQLKEGISKDTLKEALKNKPTEIPSEQRSKISSLLKNRALGLLGELGGILGTYQLFKEDLVGVKLGANLVDPTGEVNQYLAGYLTLTYGSEAVGETISRISGLHPLYNDYNPVENTLEYLGVAEPNKPFLVKTDSGYIPAVIDKEGNVYNLEILRRFGISYSFESGHFFFSDNGRIADKEAERARIGTVREGDIELTKTFPTVDAETAIKELRSLPLDQLLEREIERSQKYKFPGLFYT